MKDSIKEKVEALHDEVVALRRDFHAWPELGLEEFKTADKVEAYLKELGFKVSRICGTGLVALLEGSQPGKTLMMRADMDALPVTELSSVEYKSQNEGVMHACGHDGHMAMLMVAAKILADYRDQIKGTIKFVFQPNEENTMADQLVAEGVLENPKVDAAVGIHLMSSMRSKTIAVSGGPVMAETDVFKLTLKGKGGHTAMPHDSIDPIVTAANIIQQVQALQAREISSFKPTAIVFGSIHAGTVANIIPETVELEGTIRCLFDSRKEEGEQLCDRFERMVKSVCAANRVDYELEFPFINPPVVNDEELAAVVREVAAEVVEDPKDLVSFVTMIGEDFCQYVEDIPGTFFFVGTGNEEKKTDFPHHHPFFDIDEDALSVGVEMHVRSALRFFAE